ncbi:glycosyltransferase 8 domain-containing protein 1 isoform X3 [Equus quagga]|uniref:glycosyltransferase 8 domain-containing protein 1 isoform X3 n=1 Tax=Equus quagga TaxID=89248 RepID=UPI001EE32DCE|nr:glycosyltransferase 8 domain-containing protein 1 isoform X3 [Equus quagga]
MSVTDPDGPRPRPARSLGDLRFRGCLWPGARPARAEVATVAAEPRHRAPVKGSPLVLLGAGSRGLAPQNSPRLRPGDLTAAGARPVSMATGFPRRGPRRRGCPAAPARRDAFAVRAVGGLGLAGLRGCSGAGGQAGLVRSAGDAGGPAAGWAPGPAARALSWRGAELAGRAGARAAAAAVVAPPPPAAGLITKIYVRQKRKMSFRKVNIIILVLAVALFLLVLHHNFLGLSSLLKNEVSEAVEEPPWAAVCSHFSWAGLQKVGTDSGIVGLQPIDFVPNIPRHVVDGRQEEIPVVIAASEDRLGGAIAAINSIQHNTRSSVIFYIVTLNGTADHLRSWLSSSTLKSIRYKIVNFDTKLLEGKVKEDPDQGESIKPLTFARFYLPILVPSAKKAIYMDDDVIVQGDILALYNTPLKPGHAAAFSEDCDSTSTKVVIRGAGNQYNYIGYLDYKKERIRKLSMKASTCSFNPGVFVANLTEWKRQNITNQLEKWMKLNVEEGLYSRTLAGSITTPPLLIVFYQQHSTIDPMWNVRHLGSSAGKRYSPQFVKAAKLLHWNGHFKPWGRTASYTDVWEKWYIPDPTGKFSLIRRHTEISNIK